MTIDCKIVFDDNPYKVFYPGQKITGHIELTAASSTKVKGVCYIVSGKSQCKFSTKRGKTRTYRKGKHPHFEQKEYIISNGKDEKTIEAGTTTTYPFSSEIPSNIPSSLEALSCQVRYSIKVVIENTHWFNTKFKEYFTIIRPLNLNTAPEFRDPIAKNDSASYYWGGLCVVAESLPINVNVWLPTAGYAPGQTINAKITVDNRSTVSPSFRVLLIQHFELKIEMIILGSSKFYEKDKYYTIAENEDVGVSEGESQNEFETSLEIPPIPPTEREYSKVYKLSYFFAVEWSATMHKTNRINMPIVIGTYPFVKVDKKLDPNDNRMNNMFSFPENDPPTYKQNTNDKLKFCPFHHVYHHPVVA